jgi:hypothetical protein
MSADGSAPAGLSVTKPQDLGPLPWIPETPLPAPDKSGAGSGPF